MDWIPWSISGASLLFVILTYVRTLIKDTKNQSEEDNSKIEQINQSLIKANMKLDQTCQQLSELRLDVRNLSSSINEIDRRVTILERDVKTAFNKIDEIKSEVK